MFDKLFGRKPKPEPPKPVEKTVEKPVEKQKSHPQRKPPSTAPPTPIRYRQSATDPAPIIDDPSRREIDVDFRREGDARNIYRVNYPSPKGLPKKLANYIPVSGVSFRQDDVRAFIAGRNRRVSLRREVITAGQEPAMAVDGTWEDWDGNTHSAPLGYLPSEVNAAIGDNPVDITLEAMYQATGDRAAGLRIDVWTKYGVESVRMNREEG